MVSIFSDVNYKDKIFDLTIGRYNINELTDKKIKSFKINKNIIVNLSYISNDSKKTINVFSEDVPNIEDKNIKEINGIIDIIKIKKSSNNNFKVKFIINNSKIVNLENGIYNLNDYFNDDDYVIIEITKNNSIILSNNYKSFLIKGPIIKNLNSLVANFNFDKIEIISIEPDFNNKKKEIKFNRTLTDKGLDPAHPEGYALIKAMGGNEKQISFMPFLILLFLIIIIFTISQFFNKPQKKTQTINIQNNN